MSNDIDLTPRERLDRAHKMVVDLCNPVSSGRRWEMSIPARPDHDPDLVIADGIHAGQQALDRLEAAEAILREFTGPIAADLIRDGPPEVAELLDRVTNYLCQPPIRQAKWRRREEERRG